MPHAARDMGVHRSSPSQPVLCDAGRLLPRDSIQCISHACRLRFHRKALISALQIQIRAMLRSFRWSLRRRTLRNRFLQAPRSFFPPFSVRVVTILISQSSGHHEPEQTGLTGLCPCMRTFRGVFFQAASPNVCHRGKSCTFDSDTSPASDVTPSTPLYPEAQKAWSRVKRLLERQVSRLGLTE